MLMSLCSNQSLPDLLKVEFIERTQWGLRSIVCAFDFPEKYLLSGVRSPDTHRQHNPCSDGSPHALRQVSELQQRYDLTKKRGWSEFQKTRFLDFQLLRKYEKFSGVTHTW